MLFACVLLGALLRLDFMRAVGFTIDSDEAIVGLMGKHILDGVRPIPIFYYGQHYMGSLEAIMASASFYLFGTTPFALQLVPLVWSLGLIVVVGVLGAMVWSRRAGLVAAGLTAVAPPSLLVWSSKARGGFIEVVVLGALALCVMVAWLRDHPERFRYPIGLGLLLGLGWWVNNQIAYFIAPIGVFAALHLCSSGARLVASGEGTTRGWFKGAVKVALVGVVAFLVGSAPYWSYNISQGFPSAGMLGVVEFERFVAQFKALCKVALPMIVGVKRFWGREEVFPLASLAALVLFVVPLILLLWSRRGGCLRLLRGEVDRERPVELITLFSITCCVLFAISKYGWLVQAPRYLLPLYVGLYVLVGICCDVAFRRRWSLGALFVGALLTFNLLSSYYGGRGVSGEPIVYAGQRVARDHGPIIAALDRLGINRVRTNYWIGYRLAFETKERVTFVVIGEPENSRIERYEVIEPEQRDRLPLVLVQAQAQLVKPALKRMGFEFLEERVGEYSIIHSLKRVLDLGERLDVKGLRANLSAVGSMDPTSAVDGLLYTRWGSAGPQAPGQSYSVEFSSPMALSGVGYQWGEWRADIARELKIELELANGEREVILSPLESKGAREVMLRFGGYRLAFPRREVRRVILTQSGADRVVDWSIAELEIYAATSERGN
jgi:hypothetical protein